MAVVILDRDPSISAPNIQALLGGIGVNVSHIKDHTTISADVDQDALDFAIRESRDMPPPKNTAATVIALPKPATRPFRTFAYGAAGGAVTVALVEVARWLT